MSLPRGHSGEQRMQKRQSVLRWMTMMAAVGCHRAVLGLVYLGHHTLQQLFGKREWRLDCLGIYCIN